jgi:hypothetical protein
MYEKVLKKPDAVEHEATDKATSMLDRVKVMRVFDFAGVVEAIGEVGEMWEAVSREWDDAKERKAQSKKAIKAISDSEDEGEEMLDDLANPERLIPQEDLTSTTTDGAGQIGVIVIDTITNVVSSMMSKSQIQGINIPYPYNPALLPLILHHQHPPRPSPPNHLPPHPPPPNPPPPHPHPPHQRRRRPLPQQPLLPPAPRRKRLHIRVYARETGAGQDVCISH